MTILSDLIARLKAAKREQAFTHGAFVVDGIGTEADLRRIDTRVKQLQAALKAREARR